MPRPAAGMEFRIEQYHQRNENIVMTTAPLPLTSPYSGNQTMSVTLPKVDESPTSSESEWMKTLHDRVKRRNEKEYTKHIVIYDAYNNIWRKSVYLDTMRTKAKHNLAILEHETSDLANKGEYEEAVRKFFERLPTVYTALRSYRIEEPAPGTNSTITMPIVGSNEISLSKIIYDQRKSLQHQAEEMRMTKTEISELFNKFATSDSELQTEIKRRVELNEQLVELQSQLRMQNNRIQQLERDKESLLSVPK